LDFTPGEENLLSGFGFLSRKPALVIFNEPEDKAGRELSPAYAHELERRSVAF
jgi:hypothetical protein